MDTINGKSNGYRKPLQTRIIFQSTKKKSGEDWRELNRHHRIFQNILQLLVRHEKESIENLGNLENIEEMEEPSSLFYLRQALCVCRPDEIRFFFRSLEYCLFHVVAEMSVPGGEMATAWLHEDRIQTERDRRKRDKGHPVHQLACLYDLYKNHTVKIRLDADENVPSESALLLMLDA